MTWNKTIRVSNPNTLLMKNCFCVIVTCWFHRCILRCFCTGCCSIRSRWFHSWVLMCQLCRCIGSRWLSLGRRHRIGMDSIRIRWFACDRDGRCSQDGTCTWRSFHRQCIRHVGRGMKGNRWCSSHKRILYEKINFK